MAQRLPLKARRPQGRACTEYSEVVDEASTEMRVFLHKVIGRDCDDFVEVASWPFRVGRAFDCELSVRCSMVSRHHCEFHVRGDRVLLTDLGSRNGTFIDGERVEDTCEVMDGAKVSMGLVLYRVEIVPENSLPLGSPTRAEPCAPV
jgi:hypothetical protein